MNLNKRTLAAGLVLLVLLVFGAWLAFSPEESEPPALAQRISLWAYGHAVDFDSFSAVPEDWLEQAGIEFQPGDRLLLNGQPIDPQEPLPYALHIYLQYQPAAAFEVTEDGQTLTLSSVAATLGEGLWQVGRALQPGDYVSADLDAALLPGLKVEIRRARPISIETQAGAHSARTSATTVGAALAEAGLALQGLDYSLPAEDQPIPSDGKIRVVHVSEAVLLQQATIPFESSYAPDPNLELDARSVMTPGQYGVKVSRVRVRFEDGQEVDRLTEAEWTATQPVNQVLGYGTQVVVKSADTPDGVIEYYRSVQMYATSYSPCRLGIDGCSTATSSGAKLTKGIVALTLDMYRALRGSRVYIPGYGFAVVADVGGGIPGRLWIDLGYSDDDYVRWSQYVTVYFLTPAPAYVPPLLQ